MIRKTRITVKIIPALHTELENSRGSVACHKQFGRRQSLPKHEKWGCTTTQPKEWTCPIYSVVHCKSTSNRSPSIYSLSDYPSVWGWKTVLLFKIVPMIANNSLQKLLRTILSRFEIIDLGMPCFPMILSMNTFATCLAEKGCLRMMKQAYLLNRSSLYKVHGPIFQYLFL